MLSLDSHLWDRLSAVPRPPLYDIRKADGRKDYSLHCLKATDMRGVEAGVTSYLPSREVRALGLSVARWECRSNTAFGWPDAGRRVKGCHKARSRAGLADEVQLVWSTTC